MVDLLTAIEPPLQCEVMVDLLNSIVANPTFSVADPSHKFLEFLERIEQADPKTFKNDDEDNLGACWGHSQYTSGPLKYHTVITSWADVGSPLYARRLLAAALTTSHVARWLCQEIHPQPLFLSDNYLTMIVEHLWECWRLAGGVSTFFIAYAYYRLTALYN